MAIEHLLPTAATAKQLYACAFKCAHPDCYRPLYREDEATGRWILNSRICHIAARSEGGPRWDFAQTAEENRSDTNLILMCMEHASAIDDPKLLHIYTTSLLREWKVTQIADHKKRASCWPLTNAMADEVLTTSFSNVEIAINRSTVHLGGEGGKAPGAGGGGGGVIGRGARAGKGGDGGQHLVFGSINSQDLDEYMEYMFNDVVRNGSPASGAGGGGAGAIGDSAIGGDGGSGGDSITSTIEVEPGDYIQVEVGDGGKAGNLPGQHGQDGNDTLLRVFATDSTLKRTLRAAGGKGARVGQIPEGVHEISQEDIAAGFQISTLMAVNAAECREGLLFVLGGSWSMFEINEIPKDCIWPVVCTAVWNVLDASYDRGLLLCVIDPNGTETSRIYLELPKAALVGTIFHWLTSIGAPLSQAGTWRIRVQSGDFLLSEVGVEVRVVR